MQRMMYLFHTDSVGMEREDASTVSQQLGKSQRSGNVKRKKKEKLIFLEKLLELIMWWGPEV